MESAPKRIATPSGRAASFNPLPVFARRQQKSLREVTVFLSKMQNGTNLCMISRSIRLPNSPFAGKANKHEQTRSIVFGTYGSYYVLVNAQCTKGSLVWLSPCKMLIQRRYDCEAILALSNREKERKGEGREMNVRHSVAAFVLSLEG